MIIWMHHLTENPDEYSRYWDGSRFINYDSGDRVIAGYFFILNLVTKNRDPITRYATDVTDKVWIYDTQQRNPAEREFVTDITMGIPRASNKYGYQFGHIDIGGLRRSGVFDTTSHLKNDAEPLGSNVGFLDCHVVWRPWSPPDMPPVDQTGKVIPRWTGHGPDCFW